MTTNNTGTDLTPLLEDIVGDLDVPPSKYEDAKKHYDAVGSWLNDEGSDLASFAPKIYPQGSFALGTAVKPLGDDDYDVDAVCELQLSSATISQEALKTLIGERLKANATYARMLDPKDGGRRCWTLRYADESLFHLDVLPAIPDDHWALVSLGVPLDIAKHALCITDRETWCLTQEWPRSNPQGYVEWFKSQMLVVFEKRRQLLAEQSRASIQDVPYYRVRTPLQRVVQLLKRHRDLRYNGDDDKPISIIVTTLAARAYNNEDDLGTALLNVVPRMRQAIECRSGTWWIANPVDPRENFADKWNETPRKRELFVEWLNAVEQEHRDLLTALRGRSVQQVGEILAEAYGLDSSSTAVQKFARRSGADTLVVSRSGRSLQFNVAHREAPPWPVEPRSGVSLTAHARGPKGFRSFNFSSGSRAIPKHYALRFKAKTNVRPPFDVHWQVVNTGDEARVSKGLRGDFYPGEAHDALIREEKTLYRGKHWIECFVVKDGKCVARSGEFVVNID